MRTPSPDLSPNPVPGAHSREFCKGPLSRKRGEPPGPACCRCDPGRGRAELQEGSSGTSSRSHFPKYAVWMWVSKGNSSRELFCKGRGCSEVRGGKTPGMAKNSCCLPRGFLAPAVCQVAADPKEHNPMILLDMCNNKNNPTVFKLRHVSNMILCLLLRLRNLA